MPELKVVRPPQRDRSTAQTPGMDRAEGIGARTTGATAVWAGHVTIAAGVRSAPHHHGDQESGIYIIRGRARFRFGERLEKSVEAGPGDFIFVPPHAVHQEINASASEPIEMIVVRSGQENVVVNVDLPEAKEG
jgi:uncharacterized RmlC-like cupin family protein